jgi:hypothetical protein
MNRQDAKNAKKKSLFLLGVLGVLGVLAVHFLIMALWTESSGGAP